MGRFAQYRKRGRAAPGEAPGPLASSWHVEDGGGGEALVFIDDDEGNGYFQGRWKTNPIGEWSIWSFAPTAVGTELDIATDGGTTDFQVRWSNADASLVSAPSDIKTVEIT